MFQKQNAITGCLLGTAVGDALGLPMEGLSKRRQLKMCPEIKGFHLLFGKGMISDDTDFLCLSYCSMAFAGFYLPINGNKLCIVRIVNKRP